MSHITHSLEFFPPKTELGLAELMRTATQLNTIKQADFMTVTFGAGGAAQDGTLNTIKSLQKNYNRAIASHLTYISLTKAQLDAYADILWAEGIRSIVALRGDMPKDLAWPLDDDADYYQYTSDFVEGLLKRHAFDISVGAYPEKHPDAPSLTSDIIALQKKCDAGASRAITQFFFNMNAFDAFMVEVNKAGLKTPIVPGLLPIHDIERVVSFAARCGAVVPPALIEKFKAVEHDKEATLALGIETLVEQVEALKQRGVPHIHFYTLNKPAIIDAALKHL